MKSKLISKSLMMVSVLSTGISLVSSYYSEAQSSSCRWQQVNIPCASAQGGAINAEQCLSAGNGNLCGSCGATTRSCK